MSYEKVSGASEKVSAPKTQTFQKHAPVLPPKQKLQFVAKSNGKLGHIGTSALESASAS